MTNVEEMQAFAQEDPAVAEAKRKALADISKNKRIQKRFQSERNMAFSDTEGKL